MKGGVSQEAPPFSLGPGEGPFGPASQEAGGSC